LSKDIAGVLTNKFKSTAETMGVDEYKYTKASNDDMKNLDS